MRRSTLRQRWRYWFDNWMSRGTWSVMLLLALATVVFVVVLGTLTWLVLKLIPDQAAPDAGDSPGELIWISFMHTIDPGMVGGDSGWFFRILMLLVAIGGLIIVAGLIGIVSGAFDGKLAELRKGRSRVLESGHTVILGWNPKVFTVIHELRMANESKRRACLVILAERDKVEMEDEIRARVEGIGRLRVVCRTGDPKDVRDLELVSLDTAKSIILLAPQQASDPDSEVVKSALAITNNPTRRSAPYHVVGELQSSESREIAALVGGEEVQWILGSELIGKITVQSCRQSGLSAVYQELLDFGGSEIYFTEQPDLAGKTFLDAQLAFADTVVIGVRDGDQTLVNPPADLRIPDGAALIVVAQDDSTIRLASRPLVPAAGVVLGGTEPQRSPERTLLVGMNAGVPGMLRDLDAYVAPGSSVTLIASTEVAALPVLEHVEVDVRRIDPTRRANLERIGIDRFDHIIVVAEDGIRDAAEADDRTLVTLLQLRDIADRAGLRLNIVSEMLDDANRRLAEVTKADDFVVSNKLVALALAQISEDRRLAAVFGDLFSPEGSEIYLKPAELYVEPGHETDFTAVVEAAARRGETALGYRVASQSRNAERRYGVVLNPVKTDLIALVPGDRVIVLAED